MRSGCLNPDHLANCDCGYEPPYRRVGANQFRASLQRHLDALIEEEEKMAASDRPFDREACLIHDYAASLLREIKAWTELS